VFEVCGIIGQKSPGKDSMVMRSWVTTLVGNVQLILSIVNVQKRLCQCKWSNKE
jgi:hypothetical protein